MSHVTRMHESCHTYARVMSHVHTYMRHITHMHESYHTYACVISLKNEGGCNVQCSTLQHTAAPYTTSQHITAYIGKATIVA